MKIVVLLITSIGLSMGFTPAAQAYIGPGAGLTAIGSFLALVLAVFVAIVGFVWFPIKRLVRKIKTKKTMQNDADVE